MHNTLLSKAYDRAGSKAGEYLYLNCRLGHFIQALAALYLKMSDTRIYAKQIKLNCDENIGS